jgi:hypothetical protein
MAQGFATWAQSMAAQGWTVHIGPTSRGGWPLTADFSVDDFSMTGGAADIPGGAAYAAARLTLRLDLQNLSVATLLASGQQSLRVGLAPALPFTAEAFTLTVPLAEAPTSAELNARQIRFAAPADGLTVGLLEGNADWSRADGASPSMNVRMSAEAITLPPPPAPQAPLGPHIASATIEGSIAGTLPANAPNPAASATGWRDSGGAVALRRIALGWGPLGLSGSATFRLDAALQPDIAAKLRLIGIDQTLSALAAAHTITPRAAQAAKAVAGLVAFAPEAGGAPGVEVPLTLRDGTISLGMIPLATVGKLIWPDGP